ncbi:MULTISPECIES: restriction endonuclease subunit S [unclassified Lactococcus]|uniref:restriction endonuclease subunit S n=1 Tax=unclassified Lactococcus TaxID=2643510 RepID=UPI0011CADF12|nr:MULTISPECIES: restriction endonuclease subunit S [unclassified Lactococcus]MQW23406.1 restriction endonuclease subunit S [Lactococcus sp. dk101]TXK37312.1 restriction endonuclease subunit S [Lactococcus sp. dk310]TXK47691.1 restriction endonuclease subunit S [Lactococcus sp. dk322]
MKEKVKAPELRFPGFTDDWEERKLKDVVEKQIKGKAQFEKLAPGDVEYLDTSRLNGGQAILTNGLKDVMLDDVLILWDGSKAGTVYHGFEGSLGSTLKAYRTSADSKFVYQYLKRYQDNIYNNYRTPNIPHVQKDFLDVFTISVPRSDEQAKIGSFFKQLDDTIALHQHKLDLLKEQKKGYLQKMFPKNGEKVPELRFAGVADDWEQRKLDTIFNKIRNAFVGTATPYYVDAGHFYLESNNIKNGQINRDTEVFINDEFYNKQTDKLLHTGDIVMVQSGHVGHTAVIPQELDGTAAHALIMFTDYKEKTDSFFLNYQFQTYKSKIKLDKITTGNTIKHILSSEMKEFFIDYPSYEEQQKIGSFFQQLDNTITLHQRKLDLLKEQKKGFLQKMFV